MKKLSLIIACAVLASSCSGLLETYPSNQIASEQMWTSPELAEKGINGLYKAFYNDLKSNGSQLRWENFANTGSYGGYNKYFAEALGFCTDYYSNNYPVLYLSQQAKQASNFFLRYDWQFAYQIIHSCNDAIKNLYKAGLDEKTYGIYICQAYFLRAFAYIHLNMRYMGVPIYTTVVSNEECTKGQSSAEQVWEQAINDLTFCIDNEYMPAKTKSADNLGRPSKGAAYALRGKVYLWMKEYAKAVNDFDKVDECGYSMFTGEYADLFTAANEQCDEMIFSIQYTSAGGTYSDNMAQAAGARDTYNGWTEVKPAADFVDYYQNADGTAFNWAQYIPAWNTLTTKQRAVFFCRDGLNSKPALSSQKAQAIGVCGQTAFDTYYLDSGNEARIKTAYDSRDPRLKQTVVTPYEPVNCYKIASDNNDANQIGKQLRWPLYDEGDDGGDFWLDKRTSAFYCYRKFVPFLKEDGLTDSRHSYIDFPLIRYTDVALMKAEALVELGRGDEAASIVTAVRNRAHMPVVNYSSDAQIREAVRYERRVEFANEAINYFDEVRWGTYKESKFQGKDIHGGQSWWGDDTVEYAWYYDDCLWPWTAPAAEIIRNPNLTRRDGWIY